ncbi:TPA: hypothetical protein ACRX3G_002852 [Pseudomonas aeruginosa]|uniref:DUF6932 family protein n=1 Tax=Pseudomonas aeruginosa TaxID=287 RepID=UPI001F4B0B16|nr:hypothetical protein [Pseudomonas aeruginosa]MDX4016066.1 hypothetical protein [Pseudomonas aeruginosa]
MSLWNAEGLIPPIDDSNPVSPQRSPYWLTLPDFVRLFATSVDRCDVLAGYLAHRGELHRIGLIDGFQWLNGSFSENIELIEGRSPRDVDVVTYCRQGDAFFDALEPDALKVVDDHDWIKAWYKVDFYIQSLSDAPEVLVQMSAYWYSMWSHRRSKQWKGFIAVDLAPDADAEASQALEDRREELEHEQE